MQQWLTENAPVDNEDLERHDKWLCMMWPRLHLLKELLADDGVIFISIDNNEQRHLRMLMDEIFGEGNFIESFVWRSRLGRGATAKNTATYTATVDVGEVAPVFHTEQEPYIDKTVGISDFTRRLSDIMPNLWQAARIAQKMHERLRADGETEESIYDRRSYLIQTINNENKYPAPTIFSLLYWQRVGIIKDKEP